MSLFVQNIAHGEDYFLRRTNFTDHAQSVCRFYRCFSPIFTLLIKNKFKNKSIYLIAEHHNKRHCNGSANRRRWCPALLRCRQSNADCMYSGLSLYPLALSKLHGPGLGQATSVNMGTPVTAQSSSKRTCKSDTVHRYENRCKTQAYL